MIRSVPGKRTLLGMLLALLAAVPACSVLSTPEASRQWLLDASSNSAEQASPTALAQTEISVQWPQLSSPYNQDRVWIAKDGELLALKGVRWRADVPVLLQDAVQQGLRASGRFLAVHTAPTVSAWRLDLQAPDFRAIHTAEGYRVDLRLEWRLQCRFDASRTHSGPAYGRADAGTTSGLQRAFQQALDSTQLALLAQLDRVQLNRCQQPSK